MRWYFDVHNGLGDAVDQEGISLPDADAARRQAVIAASDIICEELKADLDPVDVTVTVRSESGWGGFQIRGMATIVDVQSGGE